MPLVQWDRPGNAVHAANMLVDGLTAREEAVLVITEALPLRAALADLVRTLNAYADDNGWFPAEYQAVLDQATATLARAYRR